MGLISLNTSIHFIPIVTVAAHPTAPLLIHIFFFAILHSPVFVLSGVVFTIHLGPMYVDFSYVRLIFPKFP